MSFFQAAVNDLYYPQFVSTQESRGQAAANAAKKIREMILAGLFSPGQPLREESLARELGVSRNTLRESFRTLFNEGLVVREANFGTRVKQPSIQDIREIYQFRRLLEIPILLEAIPDQSSVAVLRQAVNRAYAAQAVQNWKEVGTADLDFHRAIVGLANNSRIKQVFDTVSVELRLAFEKFERLEVLHSPFLERNEEILELFASGQPELAASKLDDYLQTSELLVLGAHSD